MNTDARRSGNRSFARSGIRGRSGAKKARMEDGDGEDGFGIGGSHDRSNVQEQGRDKYALMNL
jgi:hypothetical protein